MNKIIAFKWTVKKDKNNKFFPLINYGIDGDRIIEVCKPYKLNTFYNQSKDLRVRKELTQYGFQIAGYHFWKSPINEFYNKWIKYLKEHGRLFYQSKFSILKCKVWDIVKEDNLRIVAKKFIPMEEIYYV